MRVSSSRASATSHCPPLPHLCPWFWGLHKKSPQVKFNSTQGVKTSPDKHQGCAKTKNRAGWAEGRHTSPETLFDGVRSVRYHSRRNDAGKGEYGGWVSSGAHRFDQRNSVSPLSRLQVEHKEGAWKKRCEDTVRRHLSWGKHVSYKEGN